MANELEGENNSTASHYSVYICSIMNILCYVIILTKHPIPPSLHTVLE